MKRLVHPSAPFILFCMFLLTMDASAQKSYTATEVLEKVHRVLNAVNDYSADITVEANIPGIHVKQMKAKVYYKKPNKFHVESTGFAMVPRDVMLFSSTYLSETYYDAVVQGWERVDDMDCVKVKLLAKHDSLPLQRITLFVDPRQWVITRMLTDPKKGATMDVRLRHTLVKNHFLVPSSITVSMEVPRLDRKKDGAGREENKRSPARGTVTLHYSNYRINAGIPDSKFPHKTDK